MTKQWRTLITVSEAAALLSVSRDKVKVLMVAGKIEYVQMQRLGGLKAHPRRPYEDSVRALAASMRRDQD